MLGMTMQDINTIEINQLELLINAFNDKYGDELEKDFSLQHQRN